MATRPHSERHGHGMSEKIWDGVKQWFLGVEQKQPAPIIMREESTAETSPQDNAPVTSPDACPRCGSATLFVVITANIRRCGQCGFQQAVAPHRATVGV